MVADNLPEGIVVKNPVCAHEKYEDLFKIPEKSFQWCCELQKIFLKTNYAEILSGMKNLGKQQCLFEVQ